MSLGLNNTRSNGYVFVDGTNLVSVEIQNTIQALHDYDQHIHVQWIPPGARSQGQAAFKITHEEPGKPPYVIMHVKEDEDMNPTLLKKIIAGDARWGNDAMKDVRAAEIAADLMKKQAWDDHLAEQEDLVKSIINSRLNTYRVNKDLVIKEGIPFNALRIKD